MATESESPKGSPNVCPICGANVSIELGAAPGGTPCPGCGHSLWFEPDEAGNRLFVRIPLKTKVLQLGDLSPLGDELLTDRRATIVLDFSEVQYLSSTALGKLIDLQKRLSKGLTRIRLENLHPDLREVFRITRIDQFFDVVP